MTNYIRNKKRKRRLASILSILVVFGAILFVSTTTNTFAQFNVLDDGSGTSYAIPARNTEEEDNEEKEEPIQQAAAEPMVNSKVVAITDNNVFSDSGNVQSAVQTLLAQIDAMTAQIVENALKINNAGIGQQIQEQAQQIITQIQHHQNVTGIQANQAELTQAIEGQIVEELVQSQPDIAPQIEEATSNAVNDVLTNEAPIEQAAQQMQSNITSTILSNNIHVTPQQVEQAAHTVSTSAVNGELPEEIIEVPIEPGTTPPPPPPVTNTTTTTPPPITGGGEKTIKQLLDAATVASQQATAAAQQAQQAASAAQIAVQQVQSKIG